MRGEKCNWTGLLEKLEQQHMKGCEFQLVVCPYCTIDTKIPIIKGEMNEHYKTCIGFPVECVHCNVHHPRKNSMEHDQTCDRKVIPCRLGCGESLERGKMMKHIVRNIMSHVEHVEAITQELRVLRSGSRIRRISGGHALKPFHKAVGMFDSEKKSPGIEITEGGRLCTRGSRNSSKFQIVACTNLLRGRHEFRIKIVRCTRMHIEIGFVPADFKPTNKDERLGMTGGAKNGYGFWEQQHCQHRGQRNHDGDEGPPPQKAGDIWSAILDLDKGTIEYVQNGTSLGAPKFTNVTGPLYAAVSLYTVGDAVRLLL